MKVAFLPIKLCRCIEKLSAIKGNYIKNKTSVHENKGYFCPYSAKSNDYVNSQKTSFHNGTFYECDQCNFKTARISHIKTHTVVKHNLVRHAWERCNFQCWSVASLERQIGSEHQHEVVQYDCDLFD